MARLPQPGADQGQWGQILNDYLSQVHNNDGTLKDNIVTETQLASPVVAKLNIVAGQQGATGPAGPSGPAGATGATGLQGIQGVVGASGATGPQGIQGTTGPQGATGATGQDGTSVTIAGHVATASSLPTLTAGDAGDGYLTDDDGHLHVWSGSAWTDVGAVRGPVGPTGPQGVQGVAGTAGPSGATGPQGAAGTAGATGVTGATGPAGSVADATTLAKGILQLTGDLGGTATSPTVPGLAGKANTSHTHAASDINSGVIGTARLGSGTANGTTYLRGDGTWATPSGGGAGVTVVSKSSTYTAAAGDFILADASGGAFNITLPTLPSGSKVSIKKIDASANAVTALAIIDNLTSWASSTQWDSQDFLTDGTQWYFV